MGNKMQSRKLWMSIAAFLASIGASLTGYFTDNEKVLIVGVVCTMLSAAIYAAVEGYIDGKDAESNFQAREIVENRTITASGSTASSIKAVSEAFYPQPKEDDNADAQQENVQ